MITLEHLDLRQGGEPLLVDASLALHAGWKVGLVGRNGAGKTSLFRLLLGELAADAGRVALPGGTRIAHMAQETAAEETPAVEYVVAGHDELARVREALAAAERDGDDARMAALHGELDRLDGYTARSRAEQLLAGLGFAAGEMERPVAAFSGGWRIRLNLARALIRPSDLLLLDEPTNHLDLEAVVWLEQWLRDYPGTLLLISHDRDFLDGVVGHVVHIEQRRLVLYRGNYSAFESQRAARLAQQRAAYQKQQERVAEIRRFVDRFRAKATKARQAQSRLKELERMEQVAPVHAESPFRFTFPEAEKTSTPLVAVRDGRAGYPGHPVLEGLETAILPGQRIGLLGANGAGKSTLIRTLTGELPLLAGERVPGPHLAVGYFAQHQVDALDPEADPVLHLARESPQAPEQALRDFLGGFGFSGDDALEPVGRRSGGEKARLALALVAWRRPNLLLLDEPTNHLDLDMRHALDLALQQFSGAVVLVTHDRHLLRDTVDEFWLVGEGRVAPFDGTLDDYREWLRGQRRWEVRVGTGGGADAGSTGSAAGDAGATAGAGGAGGRDRRADRRAAAQQREALRPLRREVERLETAVAEKQHMLQEVESALADSGLYADPARKEALQELLQRQGALKRELEALEDAWLEAGERLEAAEAGD